MQRAALSQLSWRPTRGTSTPGEVRETRVGPPSHGDLDCRMVAEDPEDDEDEASFGFGLGRLRRFGRCAHPCLPSQPGAMVFHRACDHHVSRPRAADWSAIGAGSAGGGGIGFVRRSTSRTAPRRLEHEPQARRLACARPPGARHLPAQRSARARRPKGPPERHGLPRTRRTQACVDHCRGQRLAELAHGGIADGMPTKGSTMSPPGES